jgi:hypothetical protein
LTASSSAARRWAISARRAAGACVTSSRTCIGSPRRPPACPHRTHTPPPAGAAEEEADDPNFLIALFEKVKKQKSTWKVNLKAGIFHIGNREYLFSKCTGEFQFM